MKLIRYLGSRPSKHGKRHPVKIGLYGCPRCGAEAELQVSRAHYKHTCGCRKARYYDAVYKSNPAERTCLMCGKFFPSKGPHNRRCGPCEHRLANDGQTYYMPAIHKCTDHSVLARCGG